ncbi:MAG: hypothetical protein AAGK33_15320 [Pseudomonadota bacterium]
MNVHFNLIEPGKGVDVAMRQGTPPPF